MNHAHFRGKRTLALLFGAAACLGAGLAAAEVDVTHYDLDLTLLDPPTRELEAVATLSITARGAALGTIALDLVGLQLGAVTWQGAPITCTRAEATLSCPLPQTLAAGSSGALRIAYSGVPEAYPTEQGDLGLMYDRDITFAINVTDGARYWFPSDDRLNDKATVDLRLTLPRGYETAGPGHLVSKETVGPGLEQHSWSMSQEVTPYLLSFAASNRYQRVSAQLTQANGEALPADVLLLPATLDTAGAALGALPELIQWLTGLYGAFPFDQVGLHEIPFPGAVEQPGNIAVGSFYWADDPRLLGYFAHELAHSWFQGKVTINTWQDVWLSEGVAAWHELLWAEQAEGLAAADAQAAVYIDAYRVGIVDEGSFALGDPDVVFGFTTYMKGPTVWRLLEHLAGREALTAVLNTYLSDSDGVGDLNSFFDALGALNAPGLSRFREEWINRAGLPDYRFGYEIAASEGKTGLYLQLSQPANDLYTTPIDVSLTFADGHTAPLTLQPTSADHGLYVCLDEAPVSVALDPRRLVPAAPPADLTRLAGDATQACVVAPPPPGGCDGRAGASGLMPLMGLFILPFFRRRRP